MSGRVSSVLSRIGMDPAAVIVLGGCALLLIGGGIVFPSFLTATYLLQQLQIASFLGILAAGAMLVILLGQIDLSLPWTLTGAAIVTTTLGGADNAVLQTLAIPAGLGFGALVGLINGVMVARLRIPSMVWTLAMNAMLLGGAVFWTGGHKPRGLAPALTSTLALGHSAHVPNAFLTWIAVSALVVWLQQRTAFGHFLYAIGNNEKAVFLAGVRVSRVVIGAFVLAGLSSAFVGQLLAGYANQAYQGMGAPYLMPTVAAVVIGGTSILGGRGSYAGTFAGTLFITLLLSVLSVLQMPEAVRQILFGVIVLAMLVVDGLRRRERTRH
jgi:ribose transport system permease protein